MVGEAAWDALIELYLAHGHQRMSITDLASTIDVPMTTLHRWLHYLADQGLVETTKRPTAARSRIVALTVQGSATMTSFLRAMPSVPG